MQKLDGISSSTTLDEISSTTLKEIEEAILTEKGIKNKSSSMKIVSPRMAVCNLLRTSKELAALFLRKLSQLFLQFGL